MEEIQKWDHLIPLLNKLVWVWIEETHFKKYYTYAFLLELIPEKNEAVIFIKDKPINIYIGNIEAIEEW